MLFPPLSVLQAELAKVVSAVEAKQQVCDATAGEKARLERETDTTRARLIRAEKLIKGLASEGVRWKQEVVVLSHQVRRQTLCWVCTAHPTSLHVAPRRPTDAPPNTTNTPPYQDAHYAPQRRDHDAPPSQTHTPRAVFLSHCVTSTERRAVVA